MIKSERLQIFLGYGANKVPGEFYYGENFGRTKQGGGTLRGNLNLANSGTAALTNLGLGTFFTQLHFSSAPAGDYSFMINSSGYIFKKDTSWAQAYKNGQTGLNGLIADGKNRLLYVQDRYLGKFENTANYTTGTVSVTNGSAAVVGSGTTFAAGDVDKMFSVDGLTFYRISVYTDPTHITLASNYAGTTAGAATYAIYRGWDDKWKDFGTLVDNDYMPTETFEDVVLFGRNNNICRLNSDDSINDDASPVFTMPTGFVCRSINSNKNGILMGFNFNNRSVLVLWDNYSTRSIAPWIWLDGTIQSICKEGENWIVTTTTEILRCNGHSVTPMSEFPDSVTGETTLTVLPKGSIVIRDLLILAVSGTSSVRKRSKAGFYFLDLGTGVWNYVPVLNKYTNSITLGAIHYDSGSTVSVSFQVTDPVSSVVTSYIGTLKTGLGTTRSILITNPIGQGDNAKQVEAVKLDLAVGDLDHANAQLAPAFKIGVKVAPQNRQLWNAAITNATSSNKNELQINGTLEGSGGGSAYAAVGDEVTICNGTNAGEIRHITAIANQGLSNEKWTLNADFTNLTGNGVSLTVMPFKLLQSYTLSGSYSIKDLYFNCLNKYKGKKFYVKVTIEDMSTSSFSIDILGLTLIYDELGVFA